MIFTDARLYKYVWGNNEKRRELCGRQCVVLTRLSFNSAIVQFENGQREIISRNALRKINP